MSHNCSSSAGIEAFHTCSSVPQVFYNCYTSVGVKVYHGSSSVPGSIRYIKHRCSEVFDLDTAVIVFSDDNNFAFNQIHKLVVAGFISI